MKIFMLVKKMRYSGAYKMFSWLAKSLNDRGHKVVVCTYMKNECENLPDSIQWVKLDGEATNWFKRLKLIRSTIKREAPDISISFLLDANILNILACIGSCTRSIVCERNDPFKPHYIKLKLLKPLFRFAGGAVFQLPKVAEYYSNIRFPTAVIPNPVVNRSIMNVKPFRERENVIVSLGRLDVFQKRQDVLIEAFSIFCKEYPDFVLRLYGDGPSEDSLRKFADSLGISNKVEFAGVSSDPHSAICNAKMFVLSSDFEGIPNALIEAMSIGLPCISTDCSPGGAALLIENEKNGLLVPVRDANAIAKCMKFLVEHPQLADKFGENAKKIKETFAEQLIVDKWECYINQFKKKESTNEEKNAQKNA